MKVGDLVQLSKDAIMCVSQDDVEGQGLIVDGLSTEDAVRNGYADAAHGVWLVLWDDGAFEPFYFTDLVVINENQ
jgi:hypothetical protein